MQRVLTLLFVIYFFASCAVFYAVNVIIFLLSAPFDKLRRAVHSFSCFWGFHYFQINPFWRIEYSGVDKIKPDTTYVLVANHQSLADILVLYGMHRQYKWVSKKSIARVPFVGWNMLLNQYVLLERGDMKSIKHMMQACRAWLQKGSSVMIFPEGTRSGDGRLQSFRDGAFKLSLECNAPLVPIVIDGTRELLPKGTTALNFKQRIRLKVLDPVNPQDYQGQPGKFRADVHTAIAQTLADMRGEPVAEVLSAQSTERQTA